MTDVSCAAFFIIKPSRQDTAETLRQVGIHNETFRGICGN